MSERGAIVGQLGMLGGLRAPVDALVEMALAVLDAGGRELELHTALQPVSPQASLQRLEPAAVPVERFGIAAEPLAQDPFLAHQARLHEPVRCELTRAAIRIPGLLVPRRELADVPERFGDVRHLQRRQLEVLGRASARWKSSAASTFANRRCASSPTATE